MQNHRARATELRSSLPIGDGWQVKIDGYRIQLHEFLGTVSFTTSSYDFRRTFPDLADAVAALPVRSCVIDSELEARPKWAPRKRARDGHAQSRTVANLRVSHRPTCQVWSPLRGGSCKLSPSVAP